MRQKDQDDTWDSYRMWAVKEFERLDENQKQHQIDIQAIVQQLIGLQLRVLLLSSAAGSLVAFVIKKYGG